MIDRITGNRQTFKIKLLILFFAGFLLSLQSCGQETKKEKEKPKTDYSNVDYSQKSNILDPDTLQGDQKKIFWHPYFLKLTNEEAKDIEPLKVKEEFAKLGIETAENDRFLDAYSFFLSDVVSHKKSCEQWESFKDLAPKND
jgi:hypothetical protein